MVQKRLLGLPGYFLRSNPLRDISYVEVDIASIQPVTKAFYDLLCVFRVFARDVQSVHNSASRRFPRRYSRFLEARHRFTQVHSIFSVFGLFCVDGIFGSLWQRWIRSMNGASKMQSQRAMACACLEDFEWWPAACSIRRRIDMDVKKRDDQVGVRRIQLVLLSLASTPHS